MFYQSLLFNLIRYNRLPHPWRDFSCFLGRFHETGRTRGVFISRKNLPTMRQQRAYFHNYRRVWAELLDTFGANCVYCHRQTSTQIDHVIPYSYIRTHMMENLRPCCAWCNLIASNKVFEGFEEKYEFLRLERQRQRNQRNEMLTCSQCLLPYYSAMHKHAWLCPLCYDREYRTAICDGQPWKQWLTTLSLAGFEVNAHRNLGEDVAGLKDKSIVREYKISLLVEYYAIEHGHSADEILDLVG